MNHGLRESHAPPPAALATTSHGSGAGIRLPVRKYRAQGHGRSESQQLALGRISPGLWQSVPLASSPVPDGPGTHPLDQPSLQTSFWQDFPC